MGRSALSARLLLAICGLVFVSAGVHFSPPRATAQTNAEGTAGPMEPKQFVGSSACADCHPREHKEWRNSQHAAAMQRATEQTVLGRFDGVTFSKDGIESTFSKKDGKYWVRTDGPDGKLADFEISYTFGLFPLQQYLIELPGGRLQALGIAWDARPAAEGGQRWYHLYADRKLAAGDPLHWTGIDQNWNHQCAWCHSTDLKKNYEPSSRRFQTKWSEISVGCEACHGPASNHIALVSRPKDEQSSKVPGSGFAVRLDERNGVTWPMGESGLATRSVPRSTSKEIDSCSSCHARRQQFSDRSEDIAGGLFDAFRPSLIEPGLYHADGQQRDEVYNHGSFLQSKMNGAGVTCSDCHNPHSGKLRASGNAVCAQCHSLERFDAASHHHHASGTRGSECAACHMPTTTYMGVDPRHDHSIRIPRPDRTVILATPNACNQCHADKTATWARDAIKTWYASPKPGAQHFAEAFDRGDRGAPGAEAALLRIAEAGSQSPIARASAIARLGKFPSRQVLDFAATSLKIDDPGVRVAAVSVISGADAATRQLLLVPLLRDKTRLVRMDAARALAGEPERYLPPGDRESLEAALAEYVDAQLFNAERPESQANLGALYRERGRMDEARAAFAKAIEIDATFVAAAISLADMMRAQGDERAAEAVLRQALIASPNSGPVQHALGLSLIRQKRTAEAMQSLAQAAQATPEEPRFNYVLAVALHDTGKRAEAIEVLKSLLTRQPYDRDALWVLASYQFEMRDYSSALERAELLNELEPGRSDVAQLLTALRQQAR